MRTLVQLIFPLLLMSCIVGCGSVSVTDYQNATPVLDLETFFRGELTAHGVVKNRSGRVIRTFNATIDASWENGEGILDEHFEFNDGELDQRKWILTPAGDNRYTGTAGDVVGAGVLEVAGNSVFLDYTLRIPLDEDSIDVHVDDRMYLVAPGVLLNESEMRKFGVRVGSILLVILQPDAQPPTAGVAPS
jgi:hypothetical protein